MISEYSQKNYILCKGILSCIYLTIPKERSMSWYLLRAVIKPTIKTPLSG